MVRTNPISVVLGGLWAGSVIGFLRPYLGRYRALIGVVGLFTVLRAKNNVEFATRMGTVSEGLAAWLPVPLLVAALAVVIGDYLGLEHRSQSVIAGGAFSLVMALVWAPTALGIGLAVPVATVAYVRAQQLGREASHLVAEPTPTGITRIVAVGIAVPVGTGIVDLFVRLGGVGS